VDRIASMTKINPYASFSEGRDPFEIVRETPERLRDLADRLGAKGMEQSTAPGKWPARSILSHLADCEVSFAFRLRQTLTIDDHVIQPFDQEEWAHPYGSFSGQQALEVFTALRGWNLALFNTLTPQQLERKTTHPERGEMTLMTIIETMAGHDVNHLRQLETIAAQS
jgi:DinB superfamily